MTKNNPEDASQMSRWAIDQASDALAELVALAHREGPQHLTVDDREVAMIVSTSELLPKRDPLSGQDIIDVMQACPDKNFTFEREGFLSVRHDVDP